MIAIARTKQRVHDTFASLAIPNYRLYFIGQSISVSGTWMQTVAQGWLVLQLTNSGTQVGFVVALQFLPLLVAAPYGGLIADRFSKRTILFVTQTLLMLLPLMLGVIVIVGYTQLWMLYAFALALGLVNAVDNPTRQAFVSELVPREYVRNAVTLNSTQVNLSRAVGPSVGAIIIAALGIGFCFIANALSSIAILYALLRMDPTRFFRSRPQSAKAARGTKQLAAAWSYVLRERVIRDILIMAAIIGTFAYEFQTSLPILAQSVYHTDASGYAHLWVAFGIGSVLGGLSVAGSHRTSMAYLMSSAALFGASLLVSAFMPTLRLAMLLMVLVGYFSINFTSLANTTLQLRTDDAMRGRVLSFWTMAMLGSTPIGGPIIGFVGDNAGGRDALALGGIAALFAALMVFYGRRRTGTA